LAYPRCGIHRLCMEAFGKPCFQASRFFEFQCQRRRSRLFSSVDSQELRACLRVIRYSIRGDASILLDFTAENSETQNEDSVPCERSNLRLLDTASDTTKSGLGQLRGRLCSFMSVLSSAIVTETLYPGCALELPEESTYREMFPLIRSDAKNGQETCDFSLLLLTRRGASFRSQEGRTATER
jgi:hypothetical protein